MNKDQIRQEKWMLVARVRKLHDTMPKPGDWRRDLEWLDELNRCTKRYAELMDMRKGND
jgi:hypothetical protein